MAQAETRTTLVGAIVGEFIVGDGTLVGPPVYSPAKPRLILKGGAFALAVITGDVEHVNLLKPHLTLAGKGFGVNVNSTVSPTVPELILASKIIRLVLPTKVPLDKSNLILRGKQYARVTSYTVQPQKPKLILRGGAITKVGKAGMVPTVPVTITLTPSPAGSSVLVPTPAYTELLVPTVEEFV
jgi:hypothetical protein